jgi:RimJ/RimL family protein N-acetyltransferase
MIVEPITLEGRRVRLEPMSLAHLGALAEVGLDEELWRWTATRVASGAEMRAYVESALDEQARGASLPFVTVDKESGRVAGSTRFGNIDRENRKAEIGWTWVGRAWQRTAVNTEAKLLMLAHAFEVWRCVRVELKTDSLNERSRRAILRIGAKEEGTLRNHMITYTGRLRHSVFFSVIESEWPQVRADLETKLARV